MKYIPRRNRCVLEYGYKRRNLKPKFFALNIKASHPISVTSRFPSRIITEIVVVAGQTQRDGHETCRMEGCTETGMDDPSGSVCPAGIGISLRAEG